VQFLRVTLSSKKNFYLIEKKKFTIDLLSFFFEKYDEMKGKKITRKKKIEKQTEQKEREIEF
jgi:hypothetical protein